MGNKPFELRVFKRGGPTDKDIALARALPEGACPRRYCWWWRSLSFEWTISPRVGCTFLGADKGVDWPNGGVPCRRAYPTSSLDHFEPREPHLIEDGVVPAWYYRMEGP